MQKKKGISLIVLSITILVMAILAATAIIALEDSGIIGRSKNTVNKENYDNEYRRLILIKNGIITDNLGTITVDEYITELTNKGLIESNVITNGPESKSVTTKTGFVATIIQDGISNLIIALGEENSTIKLSQTTITADITDGVVKTTINVTCQNVSGNIIWTTSNASVATVSGTNSTATITMIGAGNAVITATYGNAIADCNVTVSGTLSNEPGLGTLITTANYGDTVDYSVTVNDTEYKQWQIYYHTSEYVYLLCKNAIDGVSLNKGTTVTSLTTDEKILYKKFQVGSFSKYTLTNSYGNNRGVAQLIKDYANFANTSDYGSNVIGAIGGPTIELFVAAWNAKGYSPSLTPSISYAGYNINSAAYLKLTGDGFYVPTDNWYWLASPNSGDLAVMIASTSGISNYTYGTTGRVRPVVCLKSSIPATVGDGEYDFNLIK